MVDRRKLKKQIKRLNALKNWQLFILLILVLFVDATALRLNSVEMLKRREAVLTADKDLDESRAQKYLTELRNYSANHMNANTGVVSLKNIYERDSKQAIENASKAANSVSGQIYKTADDICKAQYGNYAQWNAYISCISNEVSKQPASKNIDSQVKMPAKELYQYSFVSPIWSPDIAGWTTLVAILIAILIITKMITTTVLKAILKRKTPII